MWAAHAHEPGRYYWAGDRPGRTAPLAQSVEHSHGKAGVVSSILTGGSIIYTAVLPPYRQFALAGTAIKCRLLTIGDTVDPLFARRYRARRRPEAGGRDLVPGTAGPCHDGNVTPEALDMVVSDQP